jgi:hypothetical protein
MTPKEKALDLYNTYFDYTNGDYNCKQCAIIAVDEIKQQLIENLSNDISAIYAIYWEKVKQEIEKL